jgi:hypothetical protein
MNDASRPSLIEKYLSMKWYISVIYSLWIVFTHVYIKFEIAPRLVMVSEEPDSGKSTARKVASHLVYRPNEEAFGTAAAIREYINQGPGTILLDELDYLDKDARRELLKLWNLGHERGAKVSLMVKGRRKLVDIHAPILGAGIGDILERTSMLTCRRPPRRPRRSRQSYAPRCQHDYVTGLTQNGIRNVSSTAREGHEHATSRNSRIISVRRDHFKYR